MKDMPRLVICYRYVPLCYVHIYLSFCSSFIILHRQSNKRLSCMLEQTALHNYVYVLLLASFYWQLYQVHRQVGRWRGRVYVRGARTEWVQLQASTKQLLKLLGKIFTISLIYSLSHKHRKIVQIYFPRELWELYVSSQFLLQRLINLKIRGFSKLHKS